MEKRKAKIKVRRPGVGRYEESIIKNKKEWNKIINTERTALE